MTEVVWKVFWLFCKDPTVRNPSAFLNHQTFPNVYSQLDYKDYELEIFTRKTSVDEVEGRINYHFTEISSSFKTMKGSSIILRILISSLDNFEWKF